MRKTDRIEIRVTPEEKMLITTKSKQANKSISEYIIKSSIGKEIIVINELPEMITELRRIGNNINQLTRLANSRIITCVDLEDTKKGVTKVMAIIKFINNKVSLKKTLNYICKEEKTDKKLISGKDCIPEIAYEEMMTVKKLYNKLTGREKIHFVQSFSPTDKLTYEQAHEIGIRMAEYFKDFQVVIATHIDREHIHNHIVLNTVNYKTGLKFHQSKQDLQKIKEFSNQICKEYGLTVTENKSKISDIKINEYQARLKGISWKQLLINDIDSVMEKTNNKYEFFREMNKLGYKVNWSKEKLSIIYTTPKGYKCSDRKLHNEKYLRENMEKYFKEKSKKFIKSVCKENVRYKSIHSSLADIIEQLSRNKQAEDTHTLTGLNKSAKKELVIEMHYSTEELDEMEF